jgi:galacturan 1,4-alpha-galacturonidase
VPAGTALDLSEIADGTTIDVQGDVTFTGGTEWEGPMFIIDGDDVTFNGNGVLGCSS